MPRFFFDCTDGHRERDTEGEELPDLAAAHLVAIRYAGQVLADSPQDLWNDGHWRVEVSDEKRCLVFTVVTLVIDAPPRDGEGGDAPDDA